MGDAMKRQIAVAVFFAAALARAQPAPPPPPQPGYAPAPQGYAPWGKPRAMRTVPTSSITARR